MAIKLLECLLKASVEGLTQSLRVTDEAGLPVFLDRIRKWVQLGCPDNACKLRSEDGTTREETPKKYARVHRGQVCPIPKKYTTNKVPGGNINTKKLAIG